MNQLCKVCDERAAGFHFGAFTCEGCKSFFGRSYNNMSSITPCKNNERCVINKKNRTSCKACRLKKCLKVGMSKGGSRYGRRSNWFKLHLLTEQDKNKRCVSPTFHRPNSWPMDFLGVPHFEPRIPLLPSQNSPGPHTRFDDCKHSVSPAISSPESHNSESSVEIGERHSKFFAPDITRDFQNPYALQAYSSIQFILQNPAFLPPPLPPSNLFFSPSIVTQRVGPAVTAPDSDPKRVCHDGVPEAFRKRLHLDAILRSQLSPPLEDRPPTADDHYPIDLRVQSAPSREEEDEHITVDDDCSLPESHPRKLTTPLDLSTKGWKCTELASA